MSFIKQFKERKNELTKRYEKNKRINMEKMNEGDYSFDKYDGISIQAELIIGYVNESYFDDLPEDIEAHLDGIIDCNSEIHFDDMCIAIWKTIIAYREIKKCKALDYPNGTDYNEFSRRMQTIATKDRERLEIENVTQYASKPKKYNGTTVFFPPPVRLLLLEHELKTLFSFPQNKNNFVNDLIELAGKPYRLTRDNIRLSENSKRWIREVDRAKEMARK